MNTEGRAPGAHNHTGAVSRLLRLAAERGYLLHADVVDEFPAESTSPEALEGVLAAFAQMDIFVVDERPRSEPFADVASSTIADRHTLDEAGWFLEDVVRGISVSTDPLAVFVARMHAVPLLTRDQEVALAKQIESGRHQILWAIAGYPAAVEALLEVGSPAMKKRSDATEGSPLQESSSAIAGARKALAGMRRALRQKGANFRGYRSAREKIFTSFESLEWSNQAH